MPHTVIPPDVLTETFPMACPRCDQKAGMPFKATTSQGLITVDMRCRGCGHEWQYEMKLEASSNAP
jgi:hypothetical protein